MVCSGQSPSMGVMVTPNQMMSKANSQCLFTSTLRFRQILMRDNSNEAPPQTHASCYDLFEPERRFGAG